MSDQSMSRSSSPEQRTADFIIAGAGHNSLITACYLARAGYSVIALDAAHIPGGGAVTEEPLLPGYRIDSCSTGHAGITANPLIRNDELGIGSRVQYVKPDPVAHVGFPDGEYFTHYLDLDKTLEEIARFSLHDADAYQRMVAEWAEVRTIFGLEQFEPIGTGESVEDQLSRLSSGRVWKRRRHLSSWDIIRYEFEEPHIRSYMMWQAYQSLVRPDAPGSGILAYSNVCTRQVNSWTIPLGGSGRLTDALVESLEADGGHIFVNQRVDQLILEAGRCVGVRTVDGSEFRGSQGVVSTIHVKHLIDMAPSDAWDDSWKYGVETYDVGTSGFGAYLATTRAPEFRTAHGSVSAVSMGIAGWAEDQVDAARDFADGTWREDVQWLLIATPSLVDTDRTPVEGHHTVKLLSAQGWRVPPADGWDSMKDRHRKRLMDAVTRWDPEFTEHVVLDAMVKGPFDYEAANPHMIRGTYHGGDRTLAFLGEQRPAPGWAHHVTPIPGLYQTGGTTHPGGSITGAPGRNAARVILRQRGLDLPVGRPVGRS